MPEIKLYQITDIKEQKTVPGEFFSDKQTAKQRRRELNNETAASSDNQLRYVVSPGPDHRNYRG